MSEEKVMVNGKAEEPIRKVKLPLGIDWQAAALEKQKEIEAEESEGDDE